MGDNSHISQAEIDSMLASLMNGEEEANGAGKDAPTLESWLTALAEAAIPAFGNTLTLQVSHTDCIDLWSEWTYAEEPASMLVQAYGAEPHHQAVWLMPSQVLQHLATAPEAAPGLPVTEMQMTTFGNQLKQVVTAVNNQLGSQYPAILHRLTPFEVADYDRGLMEEVCPWLTETAFYEITWTLEGLGEQPVVLYHLWAKTEVERLLALVGQENGNSVGSVTMPPELVTSVQASVSGAANAADASPGAASGTMTTVQSVQFASFDQQPSLTGENGKNLDLVLDISLNLSVELGRTQIAIKEVLELTRGSVIELDRIAGEPVDLYANGKLIAKGEVVVIEDNFGLRITSIVSPADRLKGL